MAGSDALLSNAARHPLPALLPAIYSWRDTTVPSGDKGRLSDEPSSASVHFILTAAVQA